MKFKILFFILILSINVLALGISPGRHTLDFKPNANEVVPIKILNNENQAMKVVLYTDGDLSSLVTIKDPILEFKSTDSDLSTSYEIKLPASIEKPGTHEINIVAREIASGSSSSAASVGATLAVISKLYIRTPFPDKYAEIQDLNIINNGVNKSVRFIIPVSNLGTKDLLHNKAIIDILGPTNEKLAAVFSNDIPINSLEKKELVAEWLANVNPGKYHAVITVNYDDQFTKKEQNFEVGDLLIDVVDIYVKDFKLGGVARFNILVESKWNEPIKDIYADMQISNTKGDDIAKIKSANVNVESFDKAQLSTFWDTEGVSVGQYDADLNIYYSDKKTEKSLKAIVTTDAIQVEGFATGRVIGIGESSSNKNTLLSILVIVLIIINVSWFIYVRRNKNKNQ